MSLDPDEIIGVYGINQRNQQLEAQRQIKEELEKLRTQIRDSLPHQEQVRLKQLDIERKHARQIAKDAQDAEGGKRIVLISLVIIVGLPALFYLSPLVLHMAKVIKRIQNEFYLKQISEGLKKEGEE